jgi:hypothetical protein
MSIKARRESLNADDDFMVFKSWGLVRYTEKSVFPMSWKRCEGTSSGLFN